MAEFSRRYVWPSSNKLRQLEQETAMYYASEIIIPQNHGEKVFSHQGLKAGPALAIVGRAVAMKKVAERLSLIPSLAYMRGSITIYAVNDGASVGHVPDADDVLYLLDRTEDHTAKPFAALYWKVLACAASLGIIAGRGVPAGNKPVVWH